MNMPAHLRCFGQIRGLGALGAELSAAQAQLDIADAQGILGGIIDLTSQLREVDVELYTALAPEVAALAQELAELEALSNQASQGSGLVDAAWRNRYDVAQSKLRSLRSRVQDAITMGRGARENRVLVWTAGTILLASGVGAWVFLRRRSKFR